MLWKATIEYPDGSVHDVEVSRFSKSMIDGVIRHFIEYFDYTIDKCGIPMHSEICYKGNRWNICESNKSYEELSLNAFDGYDPSHLGESLGYLKGKTLNKHYKNR